MSTYNSNNCIVSVSEHSDFPFENIPFGIISTESDKSPRPASAIGDYAIDLKVLAEHDVFQGPLLKNEAKRVFSEKTLNSFMALGRPSWREARSTLQSLLTNSNGPLAKDQLLHSKAFIPLNYCQNHLPMFIGDYTDFYASKEHATNVGTMFRGKDNALMPNWTHIPVGYHGRASSVIVSGSPIRRPSGLILDPATKLPYYSACKKLDIELEVAFVVGVGNPLGDPIPFNKTEDHIFGMVLMNDWSARDIQQFEYVPLGPFLGKNFGTTVSPWIVTLDALEPFRVPQPVQDPVPAAYLKSADGQVGKDAYDVKLEVLMKGQNQNEHSLICSSNLKYMYWSFKQQLAHHTVNGCPMNSGDICGSGTISGPTKESYGSLLELTWNGTEKLPLNDGSARTFLLDGDEVVIQGRCEKVLENGKKVRIGFGKCTGFILPAH